MISGDINRMKNTVILSIRGHHIDPLPAQYVQKAILMLNEEFPKLPITLCYEIVPKTLDECIDSWSQMIVQGTSRLPDSEHYTKYRAEEIEHDRAQFWLLKTAKLCNVTFCPTDLSQMSSIPLGDPRAEAFKKQREFNMADCLREQAMSKGGVIIDFGGFNHTSRIQRLLKNHGDKNPEFKAGILGQDFYCIYSPQTASFMPPEIRMLQFGSIDAADYPMGLQFITVIQEPNNDQDPQTIIQAQQASFLVRMRLLAQRLCATEEQRSEIGPRTSTAVVRNAQDPLSFSADRRIEQALVDATAQEEQGFSTDAKARILK
jgi:hypothetical protein